MEVDYKVEIGIYRPYMSICASRIHICPIVNSTVRQFSQ